MNAASDFDTATVLADGEVLVISNFTTSAELYNAVTGKWTTTGSISVARAEGNATLLPDGDVLATAGVEAADGPFAELYDPATGQWSPAIGGPLYLSCVAAQDCRTHSTATMLGDGDVLVTGGLIGSASHANTSSEALLYNPAAATWALTDSMNTPRIYHNASLLQDGQVLVSGGEDFGKHVDTLLASPDCTPP